MRLDEFLAKRKNEVTEAQYERLKNQQVFIIEYSDESGWNFDELDQLEEGQARRLVRGYHKARKYEAKNMIPPPIQEVIVNISEKMDPEWPEELQDYDTLNISSAYLQHKFNISF